MTPCEIRAILLGCKNTKSNGDPYFCLVTETAINVCQVVWVSMDNRFYIIQI